MFDKKEFKIALLQREKTISDIAKLLDISIPTIYRKMNGDSDFYREEMQKITSYLKLSLKEKEQIFFA